MGWAEAMANGFTVQIDEEMGSPVIASVKTA